MKKALTRAIKRQAIHNAIEDGEIPKNPAVFSFAGAEATFERSIVGHKLVRPQDIVTVQTSQVRGCIDGGKVLRRLIKVRDEFLPGMSIWPHTFKSFSEGCKGDKYFTPPFENRGGTKPAWLRKPTFRREMEKFHKLTPRPFHILDIDMCGIFSESNGYDITRLMENKALADNGLLFINHQKGRENTGGKNRLFQFLQDYFEECTLFDICLVKDDDGQMIDFSSPDEMSWWLVRYRLAPIFYVLEAYKAGYQLQVERLIEYRDKNKKSRAGVNMLQWIFTFQTLPSHKLKSQESMAEFANLINNEAEMLSRELSLITNEAYRYEEYID